MIYYVDLKRDKRNTAGAKAPDDVAELCSRRGFTRFEMPKLPNGNKIEKSKIYRRIWILLVLPFYWIRFGSKLRNGDVVFCQFPMYGNRFVARFIPLLKKHKKLRFITLIHDLESLRKGIEGVLNQSASTSDYADHQLLKAFDVIICHNKNMKKHLVSEGFETGRIINLEIFDYLTECERAAEETSDLASITIAGNLAKGKCGYIYEIYGNEEHPQNTSVTTHLFGINYEEANAVSGMIYHGSFAPELLPGELKGKWGLVWDGTSAESCVGNTGAYLKYNNPHKTSLYLASKMPVIVWSQAAIADFIRENHLGIVVDSLYDIESTLATVTEEEYKQIEQNTAEMAEKLRSGYFFNTAFDKALKKIGVKDKTN